MKENIEVPFETESGQEGIYELHFPNGNVQTYDSNAQLMKAVAILGGKAFFMYRDIDEELQKHIDKYAFVANQNNK